MSKGINPVRNFVQSDSQGDIFNRVKVAVLGATGFTGEKLVEILLGHPQVEITYLASQTPEPVAYKTLLPNFTGKTETICEPLDISEAITKSDFFFLSLPHTVSMEFAPSLLAAGKKVVDLSADYRLKDTSLYQEYYNTAHKDQGNLAKGVYGLAEIYHKQIAKSNLVANPGCYPTSIILALFPLVKEGLINGKVVVDSKSAISGAGRKTAAKLRSMDVANNFWAYKPFVHQHTPEILSILKDASGENIDLSFIPHVAGMAAGIYSTICLNSNKKVSKDEISDIYKKYYQDSPFIRIKEDLPKLGDVVGTNFCDIGFAVNVDGKEIVLVSCLDNLIKGAAGAAVQNMNIMLGWDEAIGLK
ncbi:MAG: N-acetyl-gamma-glutamyl-phosphate reductase [Candidatus Omnitrophica bacterium]|nr:N-acetyl-gamma-glutamyl-phosphate reductase [Candidatus Omnitrophota bacterium]